MPLLRLQHQRCGHAGVSIGVECAETSAVTTPFEHTDLVLLFVKARDLPILAFAGFAT